MRENPKKGESVKDFMSKNFKKKKGGVITYKKGGFTMPLNKKGNKIMKSMTDQYGPKKGKEVFYASLNKGKIKGVKKKTKRA